MKILAILGLLALSAPAFADVAGTASVIDGDTIEIHGQRIRLHGIDSPEGRQRCTLDGEAWRCGTAAARALADLLAGATVSCTVVDVDRWRRLVATCAVRGTDVNRWMVEQGWAVAYRRYSRAYDRAEDEARAARRGIWRSRFDMPWEWRKSH